MTLVTGNNDRLKPKTATDQQRVTEIVGVRYGVSLSNSAGSRCSAKSLASRSCGIATPNCRQGLLWVTPRHRPLAWVTII
jgi:hypothetical protein